MRDLCLWMHWGENADDLGLCTRPYHHQGEHRYHWGIEELLERSPAPEPPPRQRWLPHPALAYAFGYLLGTILKTYAAARERRE